MNYQDVIEGLHALEDKEKAESRRKKFGIDTNNSLGIAQKDINIIAKMIGKDSQLAIQLFDSGLYDARILCSKIYHPIDLRMGLVLAWSKAFDTWEICDSFSMKLFAKSDLALDIISNFSSKSAEFEKRTAFATMAAYCMSDKKADNEVFEAFFPLIKTEAHDDRLYVRKAVNWALRSIGKRNPDLRHSAIEFCKELINSENKTSKWIAQDALRELKWRTNTTIQLS